MISRSRDGAQVGLHTQQGVGLEFFLPLPLPLPSPTCVRTFFPLLNKYINIKKKKKEKLLESESRKVVPKAGKWGDRERLIKGYTL